MKKLQCVIVGTGRCGTVYMARLLTSLGLPCGHECCFDWRGLDYAKARLEGAIQFQTSECSQYTLKNGECHSIEKWLDHNSIVAESSYMASPFLRNECFKDSQIIHVVRNPVKVVNSFVNYLNYFQKRHPSLIQPAKRYETFIYYHCPQLYEDMTPEERAALYVTAWNKMIEDKLAGKEFLVHRVEDSINEVIEFLGVEQPEHVFDDFKANTFAKPCKQFTLDSLPNGKIKNDFIEMGRKYGYSMGLESSHLLS